MTDRRVLAYKNLPKKLLIFLGMRGTSIQGLESVPHNINCISIISFEKLVLLGENQTRTSVSVISGHFGSLGTPLFEPWKFKIKYSAKF